MHSFDPEMDTFLMGACLTSFILQEFTRVYTRDMIRYRATRMLTNPQCLEAEG